MTVSTQVNLATQLTLQGKLRTGILALTSIRIRIHQYFGVVWQGKNHCSDGSFGVAGVNRHQSAPAIPRQGIVHLSQHDKFRCQHRIANLHALSVGVGNKGDELHPSRPTDFARHVNLKLPAFRTFARKVDRWEQHLVDIAQAAWINKGEVLSRLGRLGNKPGMFVAQTGIQAPFAELHLTNHIGCTNKIINRNAVAQCGVTYRNAR